MILLTRHSEEWEAKYYKKATLKTLLKRTCHSSWVKASTVGIRTEWQQQMETNGRVQSRKFF